jgi:hypothetical protein
VRVGHEKSPSGKARVPQPFSSEAAVHILDLQRLPGDLSDGIPAACPRDHTPALSRLWAFSPTWVPSGAGRRMPTVSPIEMSEKLKIRRHWLIP